MAIFKNKEEFDRTQAEARDLMEKASVKNILLMVGVIEGTAKEADMSAWSFDDLHSAIEEEYGEELE
jgi:hypothetical protein